MHTVEPTKQVRLKVSTDGKAPKAYGDGVYRIGSSFGGAAFLRSRGWTVEGNGRHYAYMRPPASDQNKPPFFLDTAIPTREEVLLMASAAHSEGSIWQGWVGMWPAYYVPSQEIAMRLLDRGDGRTEVEERHTTQTEPRFEVGVWPFWKAAVHFRDGQAVYFEDTDNITRSEASLFPFGDGIAVEAEADKGNARLNDLPKVPEKVLRAIMERRGQSVFRGRLLVAYGGRCAISQCDATPALEAAHILGYAETGSQDVTNGLLLRADLHTLFDTDHIRINPDTMTVTVSESLSATTYRDLDGLPLRLPERVQDRPDVQALRQRWMTESEEWSGRPLDTNAPSQ